MSTPVISTQLTQDLAQVGESWTQKNRENFAISRLPIVKCRDYRAGIKATTYHLPALGNAMLDAEGLSDWEAGEAPPTARKLGEIPKTIYCKGKSSKLIARPMNRTSRHVYADLEDNVVGVALTELYQGIDRAVYTTMTDTSIWGSAKAWTNGGSALEVKSDHSNQSPIKDIETQIRALRPFKMGSAGRLECHLDANVAAVLASHLDYVGAGIGSAIPGKLAFDAFIEKFRSLHGLDAVFVYDNSYNSAMSGQTVALKSTMNGLFFLGIFDRRRAEFDLSYEGSPEQPDGGICVGLGREPEVVSWMDQGAECEYFVGRTAFEVFSPRGSSFGCFFQAAGAGGIFTTLP
jgi:hypothetical protein